MLSAVLVLLTLGNCLLQGKFIHMETKIYLDHFDLMLANRKDGYVALHRDHTLLYPKQKLYHSFLFPLLFWATMTHLSLISMKYIFLSVDNIWSFCIADWAWSINCKGNLVWQVLGLWGWNPQPLCFFFPSYHYLDLLIVRETLLHACSPGVGLWQGELYNIGYKEFTCLIFGQPQVPSLNPSWWPEVIPYHKARSKSWAALSVTPSKRKGNFIK